MLFDNSRRGSSRVQAIIAFLTFTFGLSYVSRSNPHALMIRRHQLLAHPLCAYWTERGILEPATTAITSSCIVVTSTNFGSGMRPMAKSCGSLAVIDLIAALNSGAW